MQQELKHELCQQILSTLITKNFLDIIMLLLTTFSNNLLKLIRMFSKLSDQLMSRKSKANNN